MSIHWPILMQCVRRARQVVVIDDRRPYRAVEILVAAIHLAEHIERRCGTRALGVMMPASGAFPIAALAGWMLGKVVVPLNFLLKRDELQYVIDDCGTDTIVTLQPMLDFVGGAPRVKSLLRLEDMSFKGVPPLRWPVSCEDEELALLVYTSGTSGKPKGVMLTHGNIQANIRQVQEWVDFSARDSMLGVLPQFHSFGLTVLTLLPLTVGMRVIYSARFVPQRIVQLIREHRPTVLVAIPSMYGALLAVKDASPEDFRSLRYVVSGSEPLPDAITTRFRERFGVTISEGFGMTETSPATNWCRPHEWRPHSVGMTLPGMEQRIADVNTGQVLPAGVDGELQMRGPNVTQGYYHLSEETARLFTPDGWLRSGDMARFDADGHLYITGRIKEMLIIGGENVFPREIEEVLNRHSSVAASGVIGVHDPIRGEQPWAFVELREGQTFDEMALRSWCREHLAGYKVPARVRVMEKLPRNPTGKILRRELKKLVDA